LISDSLTSALRNQRRAKPQGASVRQHRSIEHAIWTLRSIRPKRATTSLAASVDQTEARQRSLGRPGAAERGQRGSILPIAGFDPCLGQERSLDLRAGPQGPAERRDPAVRLLPPRSPAWLRPDRMTSDLIPRPASSRRNRRAGAEKRSREPEAAMKRPGRRKSWPSGARPIGSRSASGGAMPAGRAGGCRESRTEGTPKECIRCLQDGRSS
jgi:hypothetical protein